MKQPIKASRPPTHSIAQHSITPHCFALHYITPHCIADMFSPPFNEYNYHIDCLHYGGKVECRRSDGSLLEPPGPPPAPAFSAGDDCPGDHRSCHLKKFDVSPSPDQETRAAGTTARPGWSRQRRTLPSPPRAGGSPTASGPSPTPPLITHARSSLPPPPYRVQLTVLNEGQIFGFPNGIINLKAKWPNLFLG
jgi:hypothetical protein